MLKVNNRSVRHCLGVFIVNFVNIWHIVLVFYADFGHVNGRWSTLLS